MSKDQTWEVGHSRHKGIEQNSTFRKLPVSQGPGREDIRCTTVNRMDEPKETRGPGEEAHPHRAKDYGLPP
jgi:hypothetical protein